MVQFFRLTTFAVALAISGLGLAFAADLTKATTEAEGRKRAAENGARAIRAKTPQQVEQVRTLYEDAASAHNAWLDATKSALEKGEADAAITDTATKAASSLVRWVAARNQALGEGILAGKLAETVEANTRQGLIDISAELARKERRAEASKKAQAAADLSSRLQWKRWSEL